MLHHIGALFFIISSNVLYKTVSRTLLGFKSFRGWCRLLISYWITGIERWHLRYGRHFAWIKEKDQNPTSLLPKVYECFKWKHFDVFFSQRTLKHTLDLNFKKNDSFWSRIYILKYFSLYVACWRKWSQDTSSHLILEGQGVFW